VLSDDIWGRSTTSKSTHARACSEMCTIAWLCGRFLSTEHRCCDRG
jgi:hypothetical protein